MKGWGASFVSVAFAALLTAASPGVGWAGEFVDLGVPVRHANCMNAMVGPDADGRDTKIYANMMSAGEIFFLLQIDPQTGEVNRYEGEEGRGAWHSIVGPDDRIYLAVYGDNKPVALWVFDPARPDLGLRHLVDWSVSEDIIWKLAADEDTIYGCTYGHALVLAYNVETGEIESFGPFTETGQYARPIQVGAGGWVYTAIGTAEWDMIALNPDTGEYHSVRTDKQRKAPLLPENYPSWGRIHKGQDGHVYYWDNDGWHRLVAGETTPVSQGALGPQHKRALPDGRVLGACRSEGKYSLVDRDAEELTWHEFSYEPPGSTLFMVGEGSDGAVYGSSIMPLQMFQHDPETGENVQLGNPSRGGAEIYSILPLNEKMVLGIYPGAYICVYDPSQPWDFGDDPDSNPRGFGRLGDGHYRPRAVTVGPEGRAWIGSVPDYGELGGAMAVFDVEGWEIVQNHRHVVQDQSILALEYDAETGLILGGTSITGGGGSTPTASEGVVFAWDPDAAEVVWQTPPVPNSQAVTGLTMADGKLFASARGNYVVALDPATGEVLATGQTPRGWVHVAAIGTHSDGMVYGLTGAGIYRVDPTTHEITEVAAFEDGIRCGFALTDDGVYFGSGTHLWMYRW